jgi:hypothetical protein
MYYTSSIGLFDCISLTCDEARNVIAAECNRSSLKRLLAIRVSEVVTDAMKPFVSPPPAVIDSVASGSGGSVGKKCPELQALSVLTRALLGKKGKSFTYSLTSSTLSNKKKKSHLSNSCTLHDKNDALFVYRYEPLDFIQEGLGICESMQSRVEALHTASGGVGGKMSTAAMMADPGMKMVSNETARHNFFKGMEGTGQDRPRHTRTGHDTFLTVVACVSNGDNIYFMFLAGMLLKQCIQHLTPTADAAIKHLTSGVEVGEQLLAAIIARDDYIKSAIEFFQQGMHACMHVEHAAM